MLCRLYLYDLRQWHFLRVGADVQAYCARHQKVVMLSEDSPVRPILFALVGDILIQATLVPLDV